MCRTRRRDRPRASRRGTRRTPAPAARPRAAGAARAARRRAAPRRRAASTARGSSSRRSRAASPAAGAAAPGGARPAARRGRTRSSDSAAVAVRVVDRSRPMRDELADDAAPRALVEVRADAERRQPVVADAARPSRSRSPQQHVDRRARRRSAAPVRTTADSSLLRRHRPVPASPAGRGRRRSCRTRRAVLAEVGEQEPRAGTAPSRSSRASRRACAPRRAVARAARRIARSSCAAARRRPGRRPSTPRPARRRAPRARSPGSSPRGSSAGRGARRTARRACRCPSRTRSSRPSTTPSSRRNRCWCAGARRRVQPGVVGSARRPLAAQPLGGLLDLLARQAVDDARLARDGRARNAQQLRAGVVLLHHRVADVGPVEAGDELRARRRARAAGGSRRG